MHTKSVLIGDAELDYFKNWNSRITGYNESVSINDQQFDVVHSVNLVDHENRLEVRFGEEKYGQGIGLIYKKLVILDTQCFDNCENVSWEEKADKGHIYIQEIL